MGAGHARHRVPSAGEEPGGTGQGLCVLHLQDPVWLDGEFRVSRVGWSGAGDWVRCKGDGQ